MNHPNRGPKGPQSNPTPAEIRAAREAAGLTQTEAGALIYSSARTWQNWEAPPGVIEHRRMPPAAWQLFLSKLRAGRSTEAFAAWWGFRGDDREAGIAEEAWRAAVEYVTGGHFSTAVSAEK